MNPLLRALVAGILAVALFHEIVAEEPAANPTGDSKTSLSTEQIAKAARNSVVVITLDGRDGRQQALGSGFVVSKDGLIATNQHVIGEARPLSVQMADGRKLEVIEIHATERDLDLAVIRVKAHDLPPLELADSDQLEDGQPIVAMGNPRGLRHSVVSGVISGRRNVQGRKMIELHMPIEPGNSGGPVLDAAGRACGIVTLKSAITKDLGFAAEINALKPLLAKPNPIPMSRWLTIGVIDAKLWTPLFGAHWTQRGGRILVNAPGDGFGGRSLCLTQQETPELPYEVAVTVKLDDEAGAAGLAFSADGGDKHYGFYPSAGKLRLTRFDGPTVYSWNVLQEVASPHYRPGDWNELRVRIEKDKLSCFVNDELVVESTDDVFRSGKAGLAKFRETAAEYRQFRLGAQLKSLRLPPLVAAAVDRHIDELPSLASLRTEHLKPLVESGPHAVAAARQRASQLEERAAELRRVASDLHAQNVVGELAQLLKEDNDEFDLLRGIALLIAKLDDEEIDIDAYVRTVDRMADEIKRQLPDPADESARRKTLDKYLFADSGYHGSRFDYNHRANSYLNRVIDDREGIPITLSVLYMELGRRVGLNLVGVGFPSHFIVKHVPQEGDEVLVDVFESGQVWTRDDAARKAKELAGRELQDADLNVASKRTILTRMLRNLLGNGDREADREAMLRYVQAVLAITPDSIADRGMRAVLHHETGRRDAAVADLEWFLEHQPPGIDLDRIREMQEQFRRGKTNTRGS